MKLFILLNFSSLHSNNVCFWGSQVVKCHEIFICCSLVMYILQWLKYFLQCYLISLPYQITDIPCNYLLSIVSNSCFTLFYKGVFMLSSAFGEGSDMRASYREAPPRQMRGFWGLGWINRILPQRTKCNVFLFIFSVPSQLSPFQIGNPNFFCVLS